LDVSYLSAARARFWIALACVVAFGALLRLKGIHDPIIDHPGWRQGDTAAIARNFARLQYDILKPQTDYNGAPPNYVELELQIVPFLAATLYKIFGVHEIFGRLISLAFGLGTIAVIGAFARWLLRSNVAGIGAALAFAAFPGTIYYSRTFMPDTAMVFFLCAAVYAGTRWLWEGDPRDWRGFWSAGPLIAIALLAKPVAIVGLAPLAAVAFVRFGIAGTLRRPQTYALLALAFVPLAIYDRIVNAQAEWHWASGITKLHVIPSLAHAFTSGAAFVAKLYQFRRDLRLFATTMPGPAGALLLLAGLAVLQLAPVAAGAETLRRRDRAFAWTWLGAGLLYGYVVLTVEPVDYYWYPVVPLAALGAGASALWLWNAIRGTRWQTIGIGAAAAAYVGFVLLSRHEIAPYYRYSKVNYVSARALDATLPNDALIVMGHYDPSIQYYIDRKGWEEDPHLWTPFDEQSAIRKGSRYFIAMEPKRLKTNAELLNWLARFPVDPHKRWPVYETDPAKILPGAEARWRAFRRAERAAGQHHPLAAPAAPLEAQ
jgi:hypothetical protein